MTVALVALATVLVPLAAGAALGIGVRRALQRRLHGVPAALLALALPAVGAVVCIVWHPVIGLWDAVTEGVLIGIGFTAAAHRAFADRDRLVSIAAGSAVGLMLLEIGVRLFLPPPPRFPTSAGVHFLLADAIRASRQNQGWDFRSRELACAVAYGEEYRGMLDAGDETEVRFPSRYTARAGTPRRELHVGDSMVFGLGVARDETFTAALETLEPTTEHVNAGIPGLAPDAYLALLETWIARQRFDVVTMYLFDGNDLRDLDGPYPCCGFASLLTYDDSAPHLRCATPTPFDVTATGFEWIRYNGPPPYLLRTLVDDSAAAAHLAAALINAGQRYSLTSTSTVAERSEHLAAILRAARDELARRGTAFRVVIFPYDAESTGGESREHVELVDLVAKLGIPLLDATPVLRAAVAAHREIFIRPFDPHFNPAGHRLIAEWIHDSWPHTAETGVR
jgi:hypothetical protein